MTTGHGALVLLRRLETLAANSLLDVSDMRVSVQN
jgi:hypothetical protein